MSPPPVAIRDATAGDLDALAAFNALLALETEAKTLDPDVLGRGLALALAEPDRLRYWVAVVQGQVVGQTAITREWSDWRCGWVWWLQSVYVAADWRGRGVFRSLYAHVRKIARDEPDVIGLRLYVEVANARAQRTYRSLGMAPGGYDVYEELWPERFGARTGVGGW